MGNTVSSGIVPPVDTPKAPLNEKNGVRQNEGGEVVDKKPPSSQQAHAPKAVSLCPMKYLPGWKEDGECPVTKKTETKTSEPTVNISGVANISESGCPMKSKSSKSDKDVSACPMHSTNAAPKETKTNDKDVSACPMHSGNKKYVNATQYNVRGEALDPKNQMPSTANQKPSENQRIPLSTERVSSGIPKGGTDEDTWLYPSPQMFWNALTRKDKVDGAVEEDMDNVISVHNNMNERTWNKVIEWEKLAGSGYSVIPGDEPKLLRFIGRPDELSPKARLKVLFGHPAPFDRHDWTIDKYGVERRYVIDYYHDESAVDQDKKPLHLQDMDSMKSIKIDVRPAFEGIGIFMRCFLMPLQRRTGQSTFEPLPFFAAGEMKVADKKHSVETKQHWTDIEDKCKDKKEALKNCDGEDACGAAAIDLQRCVGSVICPSVVADFDTCVKAQPQVVGDIEQSYNKLSDCLRMFEVDTRHAGKDK